MQPIELCLRQSRSTAFCTRQNIDLKLPFSVLLTLQRLSASLLPLFPSVPTTGRSRSSSPQYSPAVSYALPGTDYRSDRRATDTNVEKVGFGQHHREALRPTGELRSPSFTPCKRKEPGGRGSRPGRDVMRAPEWGEAGRAPNEPSGPLVVRPRETKARSAWTISLTILPTDLIGALPLDRSPWLRPL